MIKPRKFLLLMLLIDMRIKIKILILKMFLKIKYILMSYSQNKSFIAKGMVYH